MLSKLLSLVALLALASSCGNDSAGGRGNGPQVQTTTPGATATNTIFIQPSQITHNPGTGVLSTTQEITQFIANTLGIGVRIIPLMNEDTEKNDAHTVSALGRPSVNCGQGVAFTTLAARIADCASKNPNSSTWLGHEHGKFGEGSWNLVLYSVASNLEIWRDANTGLLWSDVVASSVNWCAASGNTEGSMAGSTDCQTIALDDDFISSYCANNDPYLAAMGFSAKWRLPTRNDYLQADLNGSRFVLKPNSDVFWTATSDGSIVPRTNAWVYSYTNGVVSSKNMREMAKVRCIGSAK